MNKKGFIFTFISVILISVLVLAFLIQYTSRTRTNIEVTNTEVETMNSFVKSLNNDYLPRALQISGNQAILALLNHTDFTNKYMGPPEGGEQWDGEGWSIQRIITNAMIDEKYKNGWGEVANAPQLSLMEVDGVGYNLSSTLNEIITLANYTGINLEIISNIDTPKFKNSIQVFQDDPWHIKISMELEYKVSNKKNDVLWDYSGNNNKRTITADIPIYNFRDPIYFIEPESQLDIIINKTIYDLPEQIVEHARYTNFIACSQAPDFLQRMQGITLASENGVGIESLIEEVKSSQASAIDYQYLTEAGHGQLKEIGTSGYFIDQSHCSCYNFECP